MQQLQKGQDYRFRKLLPDREESINLFNYGL